MATIAMTAVPSRKRLPRPLPKRDITPLSFYNLRNIERQGLKPMIGNPGSKKAT